MATTTSPVIKIALQSKMEMGRKNCIFYVFSSPNLSYYCVEDNVLKTTTDLFLFFQDIHGVALMQSLRFELR